MSRHEARGRWNPQAPRTSRDPGGTTNLSRHRHRLRTPTRPPLRTLLALLLAAPAGACSPFYVLKAGYHEARILAARKPIPKVIADPKTDEETRRKLRLTLAARNFARDSLALDVNGAYSTFLPLKSDTLALILSAAPPDRLEPVTWWFPIVGRVPYRGFFSLKDARRHEERLQRRGLDTYLRPTAAFSTLGWFDDPLPSTLLRYDDVALVETILHELTHSTLYLSGHVTFNESFASFAGARGAIAFFCGGGEHADAEHCRLARDRWTDELRFSAFMDGLAEELRALYARTDLTREEKLLRRREIFAAGLHRFKGEVQPGFRASRYQWFLDTPLNNATLLARIRYAHRLAAFDAALEQAGGDLRTALRAIMDAARRLAKEDRDPFQALPEAPPLQGTSPVYGRRAPLAWCDRRDRREM